MATPFSNKCRVLAEVWYGFRDDETFAEFVKYNDIGLPLAYYVSGELVETLTDKGKQYIEETWEMLFNAFDLSEDVDYENLTQVFEYLNAK